MDASGWVHECCGAGARPALPLDHRKSTPCGSPWCSRAPTLQKTETVLLVCPSPKGQSHAGSHCHCARKDQNISGASDEWSQDMIQDTDECPSQLWLKRRRNDQVIHADAVASASLLLSPLCHLAWSSEVLGSLTERLWAMAAGRRPWMRRLALPRHSLSGSATEPPTPRQQTGPGAHVHMLLPVNGFAQTMKCINNTVIDRSVTRTSLLRTRQTLWGGYVRGSHGLASPGINSHLSLNQAYKRTPIRLTPPTFLHICIVFTKAQFKRHRKKYKKVLKLTEFVATQRSYQWQAGIRRRPDGFYLTRRQNPASPEIKTKNDDSFYLKTLQLLKTTVIYYSRIKMVKNRSNFLLLASVSLSLSLSFSLSLSPPLPRCIKIFKLIFFISM